MDEEPGAENLFDHRAEMVADINDVEAAVARVAAAAVSFSDDAATLAPF